MEKDKLLLSRSDLLLQQEISVHFSQLCPRIRSHQYDLNLRFGVRLQKNLSIFTYVKDKEISRKRGLQISCHVITALLSKMKDHNKDKKQHTHTSQLSRTVDEKAFVGNTHYSFTTKVKLKGNRELT